MIVIHEIFGLTDWINAVADQLAADGFIAIAPDLLTGKGPGGGGTESFAAATTCASRPGHEGRRGREAAQRRPANTA